MAQILITYSTTDGQTLKISQRLKEMIEQQGRHSVSLMPVSEALEKDVSAFDKIVIGAAIRYGKHRPEIYELIKHNQSVLDSKPSAFFSVNLVARKPAKRSPDTNRYVKKFLKEIVWKPDLTAIFAGKLNYPIYSFWDRNIIRLIMWITKGPTDPTAVVEYTDWEQVEEFGKIISEM